MGVTKCDMSDRNDSSPALSSAVSSGSLVPSGAASGVKASRPASLKRRIAGVKVRFYKRTVAANLSMDFELEGERFQESTGWPHIADAERVALRRIEEIKAARFALGAGALVRGSMATVGDVCTAVTGGDKVMEDRTRARYLEALRRLARVVDEARPDAVALHAVLNRGLLERFVSVGQGRDGRGVNWHDALPGNVGLNSTLRNAASVFQERIVERHLKGLRLPPLDALRKFPALPTPPTHFVPWPTENLAAMDAAAQVLKVEEPELYLCHIMLRRLGLRDAELLAARASWVQWNEAEGKAWLDVRPRAAEGGEPGFRLLKGGRPRRLALDAEIQGLLKGRAGFSIGDGWTDSRRYDFIYRDHCEWLRPFVPAGRSKVNHELRKLSASRVYTAHGIAAAAYFLGDSVATTEGYYATWTGEAPVVEW